MAKTIVYTAHARQKYLILKQHACVITEEAVMKTVEAPDSVREGRRNRRIAQRAVNKEHVLRVIYANKGDSIGIITFYPARRERYEGEL
jgi:uncharacterized DUF497 family protein